LKIGARFQDKRKLIMIFWIDDDKEILEMIQDFIIDESLPEYKNSFKLCTNWNETLPLIKVGDLIIHDEIGVGNKPEKISGVQYVICSGSGKRYSEEYIPKPFDIHEIIERLNNYLIANKQGEKNEKF
jgi:hypothetical protein